MRCNANHTVTFSYVLDLGLFFKLALSSVRCVSQLTLMAFVLKPIFEEQEPIYLAVLACTVSSVVRILKLCNFRGPCR